MVRKIQFTGILINEVRGGTMRMRKNILGKHMDSKQTGLSTQQSEGGLVPEGRRPVSGDNGSSNKLSSVKDTRQCECKHTNATPLCNQANKGRPNGRSIPSSLRNTG